MKGCGNMATSVDSLQIELSAQATKANDAIDRLVSKLDRLTTSLGGLDGSKLVGLANGVQRLGNAMQTINSVGTADFTRLANNITKLGSIDTASINRAASAVNQISKSFSGLSSLPKSAEQLVQLANGIKQLGYKSTSNAIENIPKLAIAMKQLMTELSKAPKVSRNLIDMTNALAKLSRTGASSGKAATSLSRSLNTYTSSTGRASKGTKSLASAFGKMYATYWLLFRAFRQFGKAINISSDLTEVQNVVDVTFGKYSNLVEKMSDTSIADFGMSELTVKQVSSRFQAMGTAMGFTQGKMADMSIELTKLTADMASFYNVSQEDVAKDLESIFTGMTRPLRTYGLDLTEATLKEWAMKNGMDANLDSMSQMQKTMLRYNYVLANTGAAQGDFARTADTWHNSVVRLKQSFEQLGSIVGGTLINAFKPLVKTLNEAMQHVISFAQVISNALGKIFGWKYEEGTGGIAQDFEDAEESAGGIADSTGEAAKNIKKMQAGLRAFDELKVINMPDDSKSGGSGGASAGGGAISANGGQWTKTDSILKTFQSDIDTLYKLGEKISESLIKAMQGIDWNEVYEGARNFGTGLANFLNGIFAGQNGTTLFGQVGRTIAGALNTAIYSALSFGETFDFEQFGKNIADGINNFFETFDFGKLAKSLNVWVDGLENAIAGVLKNLKWSDIIVKTGEFLGDLELDTVAVVIGGFVFKQKIKEMIKLEIARKIGAIKINLPKLFFNSIDFIKWNPATATQIVTSLSNFLLGGNGPGTAGFDTIAGNIILSIDEKLGTLIPDFAQEAFGKIVGGIAIGAVSGSWLPGFGTIAGAIVGGILGALDGIEINGKSILRDIIDGIFNWDYTKELFSEAGKFFKEAKNSFEQGDWLGIGANIVDGIFEGFLGVLAFIAEPIGDLFDETVKWIKKIFGIHSPAEEMKPLGENIFWGIVEGFKDTFFEMPKAIQDLYNNYVKPWFTKEKWEEQIGSIQEALSIKWTEAKNWWNSKPDLQKISTKIFDIKSELQSAWENAKRWWNNNKPSLSAITANIKLPRLTISWETKSIAAKALQKLGLNGFPNFSVKYYAQGGFPEDGWFRANHGEIMGRFDNGKSVVANNNQITDGISSAVYKGNQEGNSLLKQEINILRQQNLLLQAILEKEFGITDEQIGNSARRYAQDYMRRTGEEAYSF